MEDRNVSRLRADMERLHEGPTRRERCVDLLYWFPLIAIVIAVLTVVCLYL